MQVPARVLPGVELAVGTERSHMVTEGGRDRRDDFVGHNWGRSLDRAGVFKPVIIKMFNDLI